MKKPLFFAFCLLLLVLPTLGSEAADTEVDLLKTVDEVLTDVCRIRQLEPKAPVARGVRSREQIRAYMAERIAEEYKTEELDIEGRVLKRLGLVPKDMDYYDFVLKLLTEQVAGYYDPKAKTFYIADWLSAEEQRPIMAHELTHALQDQYFDVAPFLKRIKGNDDAVLARNSILEGDAVAVMIDYLMQPLGMSFTQLPDIGQFMSQAQAATEGDLKVFAGAPAYFRETLIFPYTSGVSFLQSYRRLHGWDEVAKIYANLPNSTEQIMHPDKYIDRRDDPTPVKMADSPGISGEGWKTLYENVLGEFTLMLLLKTYLPESDSREAAAGWDGDSIQLFSDRGGREVILMRSVWDTEADATQFFEAFRALVAKKYPDAAVVENESASVHWRAGDTDIRVKRDGASVEIVE